MKMPLPFVSCKAPFIAAMVLAMRQLPARAEWQRDETAIGWRTGTNLLWQFSFDPKKGKTFFHPLTAGNGFSFTNFKPGDHPWHYGLWFSWKYINHVNYWEEDRATGHAEGATSWTTPKIKTKPGGSATMEYKVTYTNPSNRVDMTESRVLKISAPGSDGNYTIDWNARFTAGKAGAILDRTPMPGEPKGQVNGGYAGLGLRMASAPVKMSVVTAAGPVTHFENDRARPSAPAVGCNFSDGANELGGIAIFSDPKNALTLPGERTGMSSEVLLTKDGVRAGLGENAPWYLINSDKMRFACAAILAPKILTLKPGEKMDLRYRIMVRRQPWTPDALQEGH